MFKMVKNPVGMAGLYIVYNNAGAVYETDGLYGTSHLMEHMVVKTLKPLQDEMQINGINFNALTSNSYVVVFCTGLASRMENFVQKFVDKLLGGVDGITEDMFKKEQSTVLQEYKDYFSNPLACAMLNSDRKAYGFYSAIGRSDDIKNFTYEDFKRNYMEKFTHPSKIVYVGPNDVNITGVDYASDNADAVNLPSYIPNCDVELEKAPDTVNCTVTVSGTVPVPPEDATAVFLGVKMLGDGLNSPLYTEIREKRGLSYFVSSNLEIAKTIGFCKFGAITDKKNAEALQNVFEMVLDNVSDYLTEERFNICLSKTKVDKEKRKVLRFQALDDFVSDLCTDPLEKIDTITFEDVKRIVPKYINKDSFVKYVM